MSAWVEKVGKRQGNQEKTISICLLSQQRVQLVFFVQSISIIAAANMLTIDKDLRNAGAPSCFFSHGFSKISVVADVNFFVSNAFLYKKFFCPDAIRTCLCYINFNCYHDCTPFKLSICRIIEGRQMAINILTTMPHQPNRLIVTLQLP